MLASSLSKKKRDDEKDQEGEGDELPEEDGVSF